MKAFLALAALIAGSVAQRSAARPLFLDPSRSYGLSLNRDPAARPAFADLDGDGDLDAMVGTYAGSTVLLENTGSASEPAFADGRTDLGLELQPQIAGPSFPDLDDDGDRDEVIADTTGALRFYRNTGTASAPAFRAASHAFGLATPTAGPAPELVDIDGDGDLDALVGDAMGGDFLIFYENTGGPFAPAFAGKVSPFCSADLGNRPSPAFHDLDEDGDLDVFVGYEDGRIDFCRNEGSPQLAAFAEPEGNPFDLPSEGDDATPAFADLDGDGVADAMIGNLAGPLLVAFNQGSPAAPQFAASLPESLGLAYVGDESSPALGDVDADGDVDVLVAATIEPGVTATTVFENLTIEPICPPAPRTDCSGLGGGSLTVAERKPGKETLKLKLGAGTDGVGKAELGSPLAPGTGVALCLYDEDGGRAASLEVDRAGELCDSKPCWRSIGADFPGGKGFAFKDAKAMSDGITSVVVRTGAAKATRLQATASNRAATGRTHLPAGLAELLSESDRATAQLVLTGPGTCLSATLDDVKKSEPDYFKVK